MAYADAQALGEVLARRGHTVLTGGYMGTMEAVSRGAAAAGGHVIGVTCDDIGRYHGGTPNPWIREERRCSTLMERLRGLIEGSDAAIALPGGPGTLAEIALTWNLMIIGSLARRPLILVGDGWQRVWSEFYDRLSDYSPPAQRELLAFAGTALEAADMLGPNPG
jgi:hypothetical protein